MIQSWDHSLYQTGSQGPTSDKSIPLSVRPQSTALGATTGSVMVMQAKQFLLVKYLLLHGRATARNGSSRNLEKNVMTSMKSPETANQLILVILTTRVISAE